MRDALSAIAAGAGFGLMVIAILLLLSGCGLVPHTETVTVERIERCPVTAPDLQCKTIVDGSIEELEDAYIDCRAAVQAWEESWASCAK